MLSPVQQSALKQARAMLESMAEVRYNFLLVKQVTFIIPLLNNVLLFVSNQFYHIAKLSVLW